MSDKTPEGVVVKRVVVQLGKEELALDINDAVELYNALGRLFNSGIASPAKDGGRRAPWSWKYYENKWDGIGYSYEIRQRGDNGYTVLCSANGNAANGDVNMEIH